MPVYEKDLILANYFGLFWTAENQFLKYVKF